MTTEQSAVLPTIIITDSAAEKIFELLQAEKNPALKLRVFVEESNCQGVQFGFYFDETISEGDVVIERQLMLHPDKPMITLLVDKVSVVSLNGAELDYIKGSEEGSDGEHFLMRNVKKLHSCGGCGGGACGEHQH